MEFQILGPLGVVEHGRPLTLGSHKQRALLAILLLRRGEVVSVDQLAEGLWEERPPPSAANSVQVYVSHLRKTLGEGVLETRGRGYVLEVEPEQLDAVRFERLLEHARDLLTAGEARDATELLYEALAMWRGEPLADFAHERFAQPEIARLEDLRMAALEERIAADLATGRNAELVPELEGLVLRHPLREQLRAQLMLALYGSGRQAEALDVYQQTRRTLLEELGMEPGPALKEVEAAILRQDPELATKPRALAVLRSRRKGGWLVAAGGAAVLAAAAAAAVIVSRDTGPPSIGRVVPLPASFCSPLQYQAGTRPTLLIVSDQGLRGPEAQLGTQITGAVEHVLRASNFKAGRHAVAYQACDDASATGEGDNSAKCAANARAYRDHPNLIGVIGPTLSTCARIQIPIANRAANGPLAMISPSNTRVGLTRSGIGAEPDEPDGYYPNRVRNYVRLMPADDFQSAANAVLARRLGVKRAFVLASGSQFGGSARAFASAAEKLGMEIAGSGDWAVDPVTFPALARKVRRSRADGVFVTGPLADNGGELLRRLRAELGARVRILASDGFAVAGLAAQAGSAAEGMTVSVSGIAPSALDGKGRRLSAELETALGEAPDQFAVYAAQATQLLLDAVARSDGTRPSVVRELFASRVRGGILGDFDITDTGDTTANHVTIYRVSRGRLRLQRVVTPPVSLVVRG